LTCRRCARTIADGAIGREALDAGMVASGASIKAGEPGEALHREPLDAGDVRRRRADGIAVIRALPGTGMALRFVSWLRIAALGEHSEVVSRCPGSWG
jgi:hypothetical protein